VDEPCLRTAAQLSLHWIRNDIEAVIYTLSEVDTLDEALDIITSLLLMRDREVPCLEDFLRRAALRECV
jgi:hypothetical protein